MPTKIAATQQDPPPHLFPKAGGGGEEGDSPTSTAGDGKTNRLGLSREAYRGAPSTLCPGCGHDSITHHLQTALFEYGVDPTRCLKFSGIGCSSKTTNYFMNTAHGFNAVHGRMPAVATGALLANAQLLAIGVSGDGDTASIGLGQFAHVIRRNLRMVYVIENNGVYGLTKGQFSATADRASKARHGAANPFPAIDCCALALTLGCGFVARAFSGDKKQVVPLLKAALSHRGTALIDCISPCVTFNDHPGSTRSYDYVREHDERLQDLGFIPFFETVTVDYPEGTTVEVPLPDGSRLTLRKLGRDHDPTDRQQAVRLLAEARERGELVTGLLYLDQQAQDLHATLDLVDTPLAQLGAGELRPGREQLAEIMRELM